jgi:hypothetical protein
MGYLHISNLTCCFILNYKADQGGVCAVCGGKDKNKQLAVDHCHSTGKIRALFVQ